MRISRWFKRSEFACRCGCGFNTVDTELLDVLEDLRVYFNQPVSINSACRCETHNKNVGGVKDSKHRLGIAADVVVKDTPPYIVHEYLDDKYDGYGIGKYQTFTHIDVRGSRS